MYKLILLKYQKYWHTNSQYWGEGMASAKRKAHKAVKDV